ncbi:DUF1631 family protein [Coralloluteibacterium stylophorae]|uniref:DUF1631 domain-containing protein n=1 Tax=Coralloluteibacterium stylophorae TaxID=1776034 RepID=A0A8J8AWU0_9GAMM|nr:DUF1631 family protein [Coralloluteibacterium stylophorae]MBS7456639.1 DUF1631 domain-containing protein [Coralloluteibacterium stylophorae]
MEHAPRNENVVDFAGRRAGGPVVRAALNQVAEIAQSRLVALLGEALGQVDDTLFDFLQAGNAGGHGRHQQYFDAMRELRLKREHVLGAYGDHFRAGFTALERGEPRAAPRLADGQTAGQGELRLVAEDDLEEQLAVDMLAQTLQRRLGRSLQALDRRIGVAAGVGEIDPAQNPAGAPYVAAGLSVALRGLEIGIPVKLVLFKLYERALGGRIDALCLDLNQRLTEAGVLPTLPDPAVPARPNEPVQRGSTAAEVVANVRDALRETQRRGPRPAAAGEATPEAGGRSDAQDELLYEAVSELLQAYREQRATGAGPAGAAADPEAPAAGGGAATTIGGGAARALSSREMLSILSLLQAHPPLNVQAAIEDPEQSVTGLLKNELLKNAERLGLNPSETRVDPTDEDAIDLVGMLFDVLLDERDLPTGARPLLGRLLVPYVKVALLDRRMFLRKTHPARRLLNSLSEALAVLGGEPDRDRELLDHVEHAVDRLTHEFNEDIAIFEAVEQDFNEFVERYRRRVSLAEKRAAEAQQGRERLDRARARALGDLDAALDGRDPPTSVRLLLGNAWLHHLTMIILRGGIGASAYREALALGDQVLTLAANWPAAPAAREQAREVLQAAIGTMLSTAGGDAVAAAAQADAIAAELSGTTAQPAVEALVVPMPLVDTPPVAEEEPAPSAESHPEEMERLRALKVGTWIELRDADGEMKPAKLSWISPISSKRLFVNRRGLRVCVASLEELAAQLHDGSLVIREGDSAFEQAMHQVLGKLGAAVGRAPADGTD